ncbi:MAG: hypothetical protein K6A98_00935 [Prevotella sp.]|nr:hypothetical protein [Prevotella sp.]
MKKTFLMIFAAAAMTMSLAACGGGKGDAQANNEGENNGENTEATSESKGGTTFQGDNFTITYPDIMKESFSTKTIINAQADDSSCRLDATYSDFGCRVEELKQYGDNYIGMMKNQGFTCEDPKLDGKTLIVKSTKDGEVNMHFNVMKEDKIGVTGSFTYKEDKPELAKYFDEIIKSITFK